MQADTDSLPTRCAVVEQKFELWGDENLNLKGRELRLMRQKCSDFMLDLPSVAELVRVDTGGGVKRRRGQQIGASSSALPRSVTPAVFRQAQSRLSYPGKTVKGARRSMPGLVITACKVRLSCVGMPSDQAIRDP